MGFLKNMYHRSVFVRSIVTKLLQLLERNTYMTFHARPYFSCHVGTLNDKLKTEKKLAVVVQGPLVLEKDFTLETLKIYQKHFEGHDLILSTWEGEDAKTLEKARRLGVECILNKKPDYFGISNVNLQIVSSKAGINRAKKRGAEYALKTRTDQRMYAQNIAQYLYNLTEVFPVRGNYPKQKKRIIGVSLDTFKYRMYGMSDMMVYGHIDDMFLYWGSIDEDKRTFTDEQRAEAGKTLEDFAKWRVCETYFVTEFLRKIDRDILWTLADSWQVFANHFCIVDKESLDLLWKKYSRREYRWLDYSGRIKFQEISFREWLNMYAALDNQIVPPQDLLRKF